jgi:hypothetical protein
MRVAEKNSNQNFLHINFIGIWYDVHGHYEKKWIVSGNSLPNNGAAHVPRVPDWIRQHHGTKYENPLLSSLHFPVNNSLSSSSFSSLLSACKILHYRFIHPEIFYLKGSWYEVRGITHQLDEGIRLGHINLAEWKQQQSSGTAKQTGSYSLKSLAQNSFQGIVGGAFKKAQELPLYLSQVPKEFLSTEFIQLYHSGILTNLTIWRIQQIWNSLQLYGEFIINQTQFARWIDWKSAIKQIKQGISLTKLPRIVNGEENQPKLSKNP